VNDDATGAGPALPTAADVAARLAAVRDRIRAAGGDPEAVSVIGVTKGHPRAVVRLALEAGLHDLGENYAQELLAKAEPPPEAASDAGAELRWHFIGQLQRNKVRQLAPLISCWQSVDRPELVDELARRAPGARVLIQVNATGEAQKGGWCGARRRGTHDGGPDRRAGRDRDGPHARLRARAQPGRPVGPGGLLHGHDRRPRSGRRLRFDHGSDRHRAVRSSRVNAACGTLVHRRRRPSCGHRGGGGCPLGAAGAAH
jgi:hypothetical protein